MVAEIMAECWRVYQERKAKLQKAGLTPKEYEQAIRRLLRELRL